eukprot:7118693-Ditylum_brightwellii.AAC.1
MGVHYGKNKLPYKDQVTVADESFLCLILQDCWRLWRMVTSDRVLQVWKNATPESAVYQACNQLRKTQKVLASRVRKRNIDEKDFRG